VTRELSDCRSFLFVPGDRPERFSKAMGADAVVLDLEDAVASSNKRAAREAVVSWFAQANSGSTAALIVVRINGVDTPWFDDDLGIASHEGVAAVMLPKAEDAASIARVQSRARYKGVLPLVETARGLWYLPQVAAAPGVARLVFGSIDLMLDLDVQGDEEELHSYRAQLVLASRVAGLAPPIDGVTRDVHNTQLVERTARRARRQGFGAKLCIHPSQVAQVNASFSPSDADMAWARKVLDAAGSAQGAAVSLDGKMVDKPVIEQARRILRATVSG
jgi:citrate lyase subunit beta / citryl-CoA lyase